VVWLTYPFLLMYLEMVAVENPLCLAIVFIETTSRRPSRIYGIAYILS